MIRVTCAVIRNDDNQVLVVQRGEGTDHPFKWEFPGGKNNNCESDEDCIIREISEELSMDIVITGKLPHVEHDYGIKRILLVPFICDTLDEKPTLSEHVAFNWASPKQLAEIDFSEADIPVAMAYMNTNCEAKPVEKDIVSERKVLNEGQVDPDLKEMIDKMLGLKEIDWISRSALENPALFMKIFDMSHSSDRKLAFHASWILTKICDLHPEIIDPYLPELVDLLESTDNESALRSFLRIISLRDLNKLDSNKHGILTDFCFSKLRSGFSAIAIKVYSMEILYNLTLIYPELVTEFSATLIIVLEEKSGAIISRGKAIKRKLEGYVKEP
jgi:8-oxo-dGTP diphosphatase